MKSSWLLVIKYFVISLLSIVQTTHLSPEDKHRITVPFVLSVYVKSRLLKVFFDWKWLQCKRKKKVGENSLSFYNSCYWQSWQDQENAG